MKITKKIKKVMSGFLLMKYYMSGLIASFKVIDNGNIPKYREVDESKYEALNLSYKGLYKEAKYKLENNKIPAINLDYRELLYFGHTDNNIKEFVFFNKICGNTLTPFDFPSTDNNIAFKEGCGYRKKNKKLESLILILLPIIFFLKRVKINQTTFDYSMQYTYSFLYYFLNFKSQKILLPKVAVLANDHIPKYLAASKVLKFFNVYRIYMQHGSVSNLFPKLDYELSVLWNKKSEEIYGKKKGNQKVLTISRDEDESLNSINIHDINHEVIIFLTSLPNVINLNRLIKK